jgi:MFS superfamily sulfate permease-like transporter
MQSAFNNLEIADDRLSGSAEEGFIPVQIDADGALPGLMICTVKTPLYYANAEFFMDEVLSVVRTAPSRPRWFLLRFDSIEDVDYVAANMLMELADRMAREQVALVFAELPTDLAGFLSDSGVLELVGLNKVFASVDRALAAFKEGPMDSQRERRMS